MILLLVRRTVASARLTGPFARAHFSRDVGADYKPRNCKYDEQGPRRASLLAGSRDTISRIIFRIG